MIVDDPDKKYSAYVEPDGTADGTAAGAGIGAVVGGLGGLLVGLGALAIPGIGPVIAAGPIVAALAGAGVGAVTGGVIGALVDLGIPEESAHEYAESVRRGNVLVAAQVADNRADEATRIMQRQGLVDIKREAEGWRSSGWKGFDANATPVVNGATSKSTTVAAGTAKGAPLRSDDTIKVVEENIQVGKRAVETGGVRVTSNVREVPVEEEVRLRQEHVEVERVPVDRPATAADLASFKEGTIEVRETQEQAVVSKEARVVEEVRVRKDVDERTEKVQDTVRRTDVQVEPMAGNGRTVATSATATRISPYETFEPDFRTNYKTVYSGIGNYERFQPAYKYGYTLASDNRYQGRSWGEIEPEARKYWNSQHQNSWEDFKDAIQYSWDKVRGKI